jgi:hypothetical protein
VPLSAIPAAQNPDGSLLAFFHETAASVARVRNGVPWLGVAAAHFSLTILLTLSVVPQSQNTSEPLTAGLRGATAVPQGPAYLLEK